MNIEAAQNIISALAERGLSSFCLCPGGRLAPFVEALSHSKGLEVLSFFEERSAGFFALGRARRDNRPVAVLTTSGTAAAELLPSVIEAYYSARPLVLITADRPTAFGKKGSPQTLKDPLAVLKDYCSVSKNILPADNINLSDWRPDQGSLHLNVCFDEPLIDKKASPLDFSKAKKSQNLKKSGLNEKELRPGPAQHKEIEAFFKRSKKPLLLVGELREEELPPVQRLLKAWRGPFYTEPLSNLDHWPGRLLSGEKILNWALEKKEIDGVIRLGGVPRVRFWRDLEKSAAPVLSLASPPFYPGLARDSLRCPFFDGFDQLLSCLSSFKEFGASLFEFDKSQLKKWKDILGSFPESEDSWFWTLKKAVKENSMVFLGNSSPVRLWDSAAFCRKDHLHITGQGGVNGIEGLASRFFGECCFDKNNIAVLGDLSLLYDMAGFWRAKELPPWTLVVINNYGGKIFSRLFENPAFLNQHRLSFAPLAKMWGLDYELYNKSFLFKPLEKAYSLVEIVPEENQTKACFKKYVSLWDIF